MDVFLLSLPLFYHLRFPPGAQLQVDPLGNQTIKQLPLKGLIGHPLPLSRYIQLMLDQARSEERQLRFRRQRLVQHTLWA